SGGGTGGITAWGRDRVTAAIAAKAAKGVMHVYPVVSAAIAAISKPSHTGRNHTVGRSVISGSSLEDRLRWLRPGRSPGSRIVLVPASSQPSRPVTLAGFVPDYSDGVAAGTHRLPWAPVALPGSVTVKLLECRRDCKSQPRREFS